MPSLKALRKRIATVRSTPSGSSSGSSPATYRSTMAMARSRWRTDWVSSAKPSLIQPRSTRLLNQIARVLKTHPELVRLDVQGHTDSRGGSALR